METESETSGQKDFGFRPVKVVNVTGSTNSDLLSAARDGAAHRTVLQARHQTAGRGRQGRTWQDDGSALMFSVLLRTAPAEAALLSLRAGLAVHEAIAAAATERAENFGLKWPNDLLLDGRKMAGILVEGEITQSEMAAVVGIGINLRTPKVEADVLGLLASVSELVQPEPTAESLLPVVLTQLDRTLGLTDAAVLAAYQSRCVTLGRTVQAEVGTVTVSGVAEGLSSLGHLQVRSAGGELHEISAGEAHLGQV